MTFLHIKLWIDKLLNSVQTIGCSFKLDWTKYAELFYSPWRRRRHSLVKILHATYHHAYILVTSYDYWFNTSGALNKSDNSLPTQIIVPD